VKLIVEVIEPYHGIMGEATQELVAAVVMNDGFARDRAKARHAVREPSRHMATVQRQVGAACRAIAAAKRVDEVKKIRDVSIAMRAYARQAENLDMEADAVEIRMRATRRMDHMRQEQKETVGLNSGSRGVGTKVRVDKKPTLAEAGIGKNLAHEGRKLGALSEYEFEEAVTTAREAIGRVVKDAIRADDKKERRADRERELAAKQMALPDMRYGVIVADPEWKFEPWSRETGMDRAADNHYPTSVTEVIAARPVVEIAADDCVLFQQTGPGAQPVAPSPARPARFVLLLDHGN
jgi:hypothetical protein